MANKKVYMVYEVKNTEAKVHSARLEAVPEGTEILPPKHTVRMFAATTRKQAQAIREAVIAGIVSEHGTTIMSSDRYRE